MASTTKLLIVFGFVFTLALVIAGSYYVWQEMGSISLGFHGWLAVILGSVGTFGLGAGLMWLSFYSHHRGYDEKAADQEDWLE